ncbi:hypothetical protein ACIQW5_24875 [Methylorubrum thiocyanatum]|jgi:hypothetical protein|uniref:hypothetical protein n=1 Tax=Methylorubrum thiocyanatum TaxID=47958 RepID=UPI00383ABB1A
MFQVIQEAYINTGEPCPGDLAATFTAPPDLQTAWATGDARLRRRLEEQHDVVVAAVVEAAVIVNLIPADTKIQRSRFALESHLDLPTIDAEREVALRNAADKIGAAYLANLRDDL